MLVAHRCGLSSQVTCGKNPLTPKMMQKHMQWVRNDKGWTLEEWRKGLFYDEHIVQGQHCHHVWHSIGQTKINFET